MIALSISLSIAFFQHNERGKVQIRSNERAYMKDTDAEV